MTTTIKKINKEKTHQKHASNVEAAAMKHSQEKKMPPFLSTEELVVPKLAYKRHKNFVWDVKGAFDASKMKGRPKNP